MLERLNMGSRCICLVALSLILNKLVGVAALPAPEGSSSGWNKWEHPTCPLNNTWTQIALRHPPTVAVYGTPSDLSWPQPPRSFIFGNWHVTHSSRSAYQYLYNFQHDCYPVLPTESLFTPENEWLQVDLTSFNLPLTGNATADQKLHAVYGLDTPEWDIAPFVFKFRGGGTLSELTSVWELAAWGYDTNGNAYRVEYETQVVGYEGESAMLVVSRVPDGPSDETYQAILETMKSVYADDKDLSAYARNTTKLPRDGRRDGQGVVGCDAKCMMNE